MRLALCLIVFCSSAVASPAEDLRDIPIGVTSVPGLVESRSIVFEDEHSDPYDRTNLHGFNHAPSVTSLGDDRVMCIWFSGPFEASVHQLILGSISKDGGKTWGEATVVNDTPHVSDFDPAFVNAGRRTLLFFSNGRWETRPRMERSASGRPGIGVDSFHMLFKTSDDQGRSWSDAREVGAGPGWNCRSNGIRLHNGELLLPTHHLQDPFTSSVLISSDDGQTWQRGPSINTPGTTGAAEPSVAQLPDESLVMVLRTRDGNLWLTRSTDLGRSWTEPEQQDLPATSSSASLFCTSSGKLVLTHNPTTPPLRTELTLRTSTDGGQSWSAPLLLDEVQPPTKDEPLWSRQVCYPSVCELSNDLLLVVWARMALGPVCHSGVICAAHVRLK